MLPGTVWPRAPPPSSSQTHGGRQLDGVVPTPLALPEVAEAVGDRVEVYVDGGVRTGSHVLKALALGARAVLVGRPVIWALATGGSDGVRGLLDEMASEVEEALALAGCPRAPRSGPTSYSGRTTTAAPQIETERP